MFDVKKEQAIELLSLGQMEYQEIAEVVGVTSKTLREWRYNQDFAEEVQRRALELLKEAVPSIYGVLSRKGKSGDLAAIKILLDQVERATADVVKSAEGSITFTWGKNNED